MLNVLRSKNFSLLFSGRLLTNLGDSIYNVAAMWLVFQLTGSSFYTGIAGTLIMLPGIFEFFVGPLVDRWPVKAILVHTQWIQAVIIMIIPLLYYFNILNVWAVIIIMFLATAIEQIVYPAQQATLPRILKKEELVAGNSLMTFAYQGIDIVLVGLSGLLIVYIGVINIYLIDISTFVLAAVIFSKLTLNTKDIQPDHKSRKKPFSYLRELREGKDFVFNSKLLRMLIPLSFINGVFGMITAIMPELSNKTGGETFYGYSLATMSVSLLIGSFLAQYAKKFPLGYTTIFCFFVSSIFWFLSYYTNYPALMLLFFGLAFIPIGIHKVILISTIQTIVPEGMVGRVFTIFGSMSTLFLPVGSFLGGYFSTKLDIELVYSWGSFAICTLAFYWMIIPSLRKMPSPENNNCYINDKLTPTNLSLQDKSTLNS
ncbi:MFS transporter [Bacillus cabrialesii]|uniref:MFS transporter n=1 Tax=Bacillus cabrialesii TaxID=2487276 RepID=UPI003CE703C8